MTGIPDPRFCTCCEAPAPRAPADIWNRPSLPELSYRIGTFATFRQAMLEAISDEPTLAALSTRESDDFAVTLLELFAAVGDVLTFYNERTANELFLRTARERDSLLRLVRLIGYRLRPGLAATTLLAFTLDDGALTRIRRGLKVMSLPAQDQRPQTFQTLEQIAADARLNALPVFAPSEPFNAFHTGRREAPIVSRPDPLGPGDRLVIFGLSQLEEKEVAGLDAAADGERLRLTQGVQSTGLWPGVARAAKVTRRLRFFGHDAPASHQIYDTSSSTPPQQRWSTQTIDGSFAAAVTNYPLATRYDDLKSGARILVDAGPTAAPRLRTAVVVATQEDRAALGPLADTVTYAALRQTLRGRPAATVRPGGTAHVFARSGAGHILTMETPGATTWSSFGGAVASEDPAAVAIDAGTVRLFVRGATGRLYQNVWTPGSWGGWIDHGGILFSPPAPVKLAGDDVMVFVRGPLFGLYVLRVTGGVAGTWTPLGGVLTSTPVPVSAGGSSVDVFARGLDRGFWRRHWDGTSWSAWESLNGTLASEPAAAATAAGSLDVVALDDDGALIHRRLYAGRWSDWRNLGGRGSGPPAIVATGADRVDILVRGEDAQAWHIARTGEDFGPWVSLGGAIASAPTVVTGAGSVQVFARGMDGALAARSWSPAGWSPWAGLGDGLGGIPDRQATRIYEIATPVVTFREYDHPRRITGGRVVAKLAHAPGLKKLDKDRRILLDDGSTKHAARVSATALVAATPGEASDHLVVDFAPSLPAPLGATLLKGNLALSSHGETQPEEPLGNGNAAQAFQRFTLSRSPLTYLPSESDIAGKAELEIRANRELWRRVPSLYGRGPTERTYTARQNDDGSTVVTFGDGRTGARLPTGAMNVVARYRTGVGLEGRMAADQLSIPLERPVGLRAVTNPLAATGAADPETRDDARSAAPTTVRTFGRAVSLRDFEWLSVTSGLVKRAHATWVWRNHEKTVHLTVAGAEGARLTGEEIDTLHAALTAARDPNRSLLIGNLTRIPVVVQAKLLRDPDFVADDVAEAARADLLDHFAFAAMPLGVAVPASTVYAVLQGARGVVAVDLDLFHLKGHGDLTPDERDVRAVTAAPVQPHIRIFPARPVPADPADIDRYARAGFDGTEPPAVLAAEQVYIDDPAADVALTVVESL